MPNALKCPCVSIKHALKKQGIKTLKPLISQGFQVSVSILVTQDGCGGRTWTSDLRVMRNAPWISYSPIVAHIIPGSQYFQGFRGICIRLRSHPVPWNLTAVGVSVGVNSKRRSMRWPILLAQPRKKRTFRFLPLRGSVHWGSDRTRNRPSGIRIVPTLNSTMSQHY